MASLRLSLLLAAVAAPMSAATAQQNLPRAETGVERPRGRVFVNSWSLDTAINYSDNFSRLAEGDYERRFVLDGETFAGVPIIEEGPNGPFVASVVPLADTVALEPLEKSFVTFTLSGTSLFERPDARGILTGGVRVGHYLDGESYGDSIEAVLNANLPAELEDFPDSEVTPTVGIGDAFNQTFIDPNMSGLTQVDLAGELLYLEAGGFLTEQNFGGNAGIVQQAAGQNLNEVIFGGYFLSPISFLRLPQGQAAEFRARHSSVFVVDENFSDIVRRSVPDLGTSVSDDVSAGYSSGQVLSFVQFSFGVSARRFVEESDNTDFTQEFEHLSAYGGVAYDLTPRLTLTAQGGYDDAIIDTQPTTPLALEGEAPPPVPDTVQQDLSGGFYTLGFTYRPSGAAMISASWGERFEGTQYQARVNWDITPRLTLGATVNRQVTSGLQELQDENVRINSVGLGLTQRFGDQGRSLTDRDLDNIGPSTGNLPTAQARTGIRRTTNANLSLSGAYARSNWSLRVGASIPEAEDNEDAELAVNLINNKRYTADVQASRLINRRLRLGVQARALAQIIDGDAAPVDPNAFVVRRQFTDDVIEQLYGVSASYVLTRNTSLNASYNHLRRSTDEPEDLSLFAGTAFEYQENQVRVGARLRF